MPWSMRTEGGQVLVVRQRDKKVVGRHKDRKRALAQLRVLSSLEKAQFASRSEAGRYAANMRWQGQGKTKLNVERYGDNKQYAEVRSFEIDGKKFNISKGGDSPGAGMYNGYMAAFDNGKNIGYIDYHLDSAGKKATVAMIFVEEGYRRRGIAEALLDSFITENPSYEVSPGYTTEEGEKWWRSVIGSDGPITGLSGLETDALDKARFSSRSEAGRYAANMRWQGNVKGDDKKYSKELTTKEMVNILYEAKSVQDALGLIAKSLGKDAKPQLRVLDDSEVTHYRGASDPTASIGFVLDWSLNDIPYATWGQGLYITPLREEASIYGKPYRVNLDKSAKLIIDEVPWSEGDKWLKVKSSEPYESSKVVNYSKLKFNPSGSDLINFYWASKGYDGAFIQGDEVVLFNGSKLTVDKRDLSSKEIKKFLTNLVKASFGGDRSEAGRYAANQRWKNQTPKQKLDALGSKELKIVEIRGDETFKKKDGSVTRRATLIVLDDNGKEMWVDVTSKGKKGQQFIVVEAKRGNNQIGYLWAETDHHGEYGQKGKVAIGQVDVVASERRKGVATALMRLGKRYNIGSEPIYHSTVLTTAGAAFARDTEIEKASFGGNRSEAGRYAANMRWQGQGQKEQEKVGLDGYPKINNDLEELFINTPILNSGLGKTMREINKEISQRESNGEREDEMLPAVILSAYLGKGSNEFYGALNRHLRRGNPLKDSLREKLSEEDEEQVERLEREIRQLERDQDEDDDTDNSSEIESLREEIAEIEGEDDDDDERIDADDWNYDEHSESDFDSQYGSIPISINGEDVKMPKVVAYGLMDDAFRELSMVMPSNLRVYRGIDPETITSLEASVGKTVEDLGFCSTSTDPNKAIAFSGVGVPMQSQLQTEYYKEGDTLSSDKRIATILIPKGLKVVMPNRGGEGEVILNRGTQFEVVGVNETGPILKVVANNENN